MKNTKLKISAAVIFMLCFEAHSQNSWQLNGNNALPPNTVTPASFVGTTIGVPFNLKTTLAQPMNFFTSNTQRMTITSTGLVGIGLLGPSSLLHLQSNTASGGNLFRTDGLSTQLNNWQLFTGGSEKFSLYVPAGSNSVFLNAFDPGGSMRFQTGGATRMYIRESNLANPGFVGIGLNYTSPASLLHVNGTQNNTGLLFGTSGLTTLDNIWRMHTGPSPGNGTERFRMMIPKDSVNIHFNMVDVDGNMQFQTGSVTRLFIQQGMPSPSYGVNTSGFIGIGTNIPASPLHIVGKEALNSIGGWRRAITISQGSIAFVNDDNTSPAFFMAYQSIAPNGNFYAGTQVSLDQTNSDVDYAYTIGTQTPIGGVGSPNPLNSFQFYKNVVITEGGFERRMGINTTNPQNVLQINTDDTSPVPGNSGLRLQDLTSVSDIQPNPGSGVLSVSENGDIIYVSAGDGGSATDNQNLTSAVLSGNTLTISIEDGNPVSVDLSSLASSTVLAQNGTSVSGGIVVLGNDVGGTAAQLSSNRDIPLGNRYINFNQQGNIHFSQGSTGLNSTATLDINNQNSNNTVGYYFNGFNGSNNNGLKGFFGEMNLNNSTATNNSALMELSNTEKAQGSRGWLIKANGFYGGSSADLIDQASFGVLGNGNTYLNANMSSYGANVANLFVSDHAGNSNNGGHPFLGPDGLARTMMVSSTNTSSVNYALDVYAQNTSGANPTGIRAVAQGLNNSTSPIAIQARAFTDNTTASGTVIGVNSTVRTNGTMPQNIGISVESKGSLSTNIGIDVNLNNTIDEYASFNSPAENIGVNAVVNGSSFRNIGVQGKVSNRDGGIKNYGVYGSASGGDVANYGIYGAQSSGGTGTQYAGFFQGNVQIDGDFILNGQLSGSHNIQYASDQNLKTNIESIDNANDIIDQLNPSSFYFDTIDNHGFNFSSKKQYGFIAQEVEQILPELVTNVTKPADYDSVGNIINPVYDYKSLNYNAFIGILTQAVKEQQNEIEQKDSLIDGLTDQVNDLNTRLSQLENCLSALLPTLCNMNQQAVQQTPQEIQRQLKERLQVSLSDKNTIVLSQNVPNPFAEQTVIEYSIPENVQTAQIHFYNAQGKLIQTVDLNERGNGELTVFANDLSSGIYTYSLVADGKVVATKKMMKK